MLLLLRSLTGSKRNMARCSVPQVPAAVVLPTHVAGAARRFREDRGLPVSQYIGTDDPALIELFLIVEGYVRGPGPARGVEASGDADPEANR